jgi:hypothetical protein
MERVRMEGRRLGRTPKRDDPRTLRLANLLTTPPPPPARLDVTAGIATWPMYANDQLCDCTCCALAHMLEVWTKETAGKPRLLTDAQVIALYDLVNGGKDQGASMLDVLQQMRSGAGLAGDHLYAYAAVDHTRPGLVRSAAWLFEGLYIGIQMPLSAHGQAHAGKEWHPVDGPKGKRGSWGGHTVNVVAYDDSGLTVITWGAKQRMTWAFWQQYVEECWALLPVDFQRRRGPLEANGFDFAQLDRYLAQLGPVNPAARARA